MHTPGGARFYFDYVDPLSYLVDREIEAAVAGADGMEIVLVPLELRPPPEPLLDPDGTWWRERWKTATTLAAGSDATHMTEPALLPWTRKAHELVAHSRSVDLELRAHRAVFRAVFAEGRDIGRVDVLVDLARELGLDPTEAKAVLDVDRYTEDVASRRSAALEVAGRGPPVLVHGDQTLRGFHNRDAVRTFLLR